MGGVTNAKRLMVVDDIASKDEEQKTAMRISEPVGIENLAEVGR